MKFYIDGVIVVEGTNDESYLSSFIDAHFVITNGYEIPQSEICFLKEAAKTKKIIILTDSDEAGFKIRNKLNEILVGCENPIVDITKCNNHGKHGVKECEKDEIIRVLHGFFEEKKENSNSYELFLGFGEDSKNKRNAICKKYNLGRCNNKKMIKRLSFLNIPINDVKEFLINGN